VQEWIRSRSRSHMFGYNRSRSRCFQVQPATCCDPFGVCGLWLFFLVNSIDSSKTIGNFPGVLDFQPVVSQTQPVHL
jgi:hypothetical protein